MKRFFHDERTIYRYSFLVYVPLNQRYVRNFVRKDHKNTAPKITAKLNDHLENPVSSKTIGRELYKTRFHRRAIIRNHTKINLFEISRCFHYFVQPLYRVVIQNSIEYHSSMSFSILWCLVFLAKISSQIS